MNSQKRDGKNGGKTGLLRCYRNIFFMLGIVIRHTPLYFVNFCLFQIYCALQVFFEFTYPLKVLLDFIAQ